MPRAFTVGSFATTIIVNVRGTGSGEVAMKTPLLIVLTVVVLGFGSTLAIMNNACKSSHHTWCAPISDVRHQTKTGLG